MIRAKRESLAWFLKTAAISFAAYFPVGALAQDVEDEIFDLSPFQVEVSGDVMYLSTNSVSGTSLNTELIRLPMSVQVINRELITDLGATDLSEALEYSAGVFTSNTAASNTVGANRATGGGDRSISSAGSGNRFANVVYIRGLAVPFQNRMGFRYGGVVVTPNSAIALGGLMDSTNMERMEVVKGPNSLLYGTGVLTGIVNVLPKRPLSAPRYEATVNVGSYDFYRGTVDFTGPILGNQHEWFPGQLNYRATGSYEQRGHWTDYRKSEVRYSSFQLEHLYTNKTRLFLEFQKGFNRIEGIGSQWIYDDLSRSNDTEFRNSWDEAFAWARHEGTIERLRPIDPNGFNNSVATTVGNQAGFRLMGAPFEGGALPDSYRITGPDTFAERDEWNFIADLEVMPLPNMTLNAGVFIADQETNELNVRNRGFSSSNPNQFNRDTVHFDRQLNGIWNAGGIYGVPMQDAVQASAGINIRPAPSVDGDWIFPALSDDIKLVEYFWERNLVKSYSRQARLRGTYTFEDKPWFFGTSAEHTILVGMNMIRDKIDFPDGNINPAHARANPSGLTNSPQDRATATDLYSNDGLYYRSIANFAPIYLDGRNDGVDGHNTVRAGRTYLNQRISQDGYYGVYHGKLFDDRLDVIFGLRRDIYNADQFTYKRVNISDQELLARADSWVNREVATEVGSRYNVSTNNVLSGNISPEAMQFRNQLFEQRTADGQYVTNYYHDFIESSTAGAAYYGGGRAGPVDEYYGRVPLSERRIFDRNVKIDTATFAASYAIRPNLNVYGVVSEGVAPNTALRDGNGEIIPAETTRNREFGVKFDVLDGRISGSIAYFNIDRKNAIWNVPIAPAASKWFDAQLEANRSREWSTPTYDPSIGGGYYVTQEYFYDYIGSVLGVDPDSIRVTGQGNTIVQTVDPMSIPDDIAPTMFDKIVLVNQINTQTRFPDEMIDGSNNTQQFGGNVSINNIGLKAEGLDGLYEVTLYNPETGEFVDTLLSSAAILHHAFAAREIDKTKNSFLQNVHPIRYRNFDGFQPQQNNNVSLNAAQGAMVTFDERIEGVEMDFVFTINRNFQIVTSYTHTKRQGRGSFNFTGWESIATGDRPFVPVFTMLHREYGWAEAGIQPAWVDYAAYQNAMGADGMVNRADLADGTMEFLDNPDERLAVNEFAQRNQSGQVMLYFDRNGDVVNNANPARPSDYDQLVNGVSLNFNPEDEAALWGKYTFTEGVLENLSLTFGVKYVGKAKTSVTFKSASPLNPLTVTPEVADHFKFDTGLAYAFDWDRFRMRLSLNVYNIFQNRYDVTTTTLGIDNPITGEPVHKRTERFYSPRSVRLGMTVSF